MIVFSRWAIVIVVQSENSLRIVCWMMASVLDMYNNENIHTSHMTITHTQIHTNTHSTYTWRWWSCDYDVFTHVMSTLAVASSMTRILFLLRSALPKHISCLWPTLKLEPLSVTAASSWFFISWMCPLSCTWTYGDNVHITVPIMCAQTWHTQLVMADKFNLLLVQPATLQYTESIVLDNSLEA